MHAMIRQRFTASAQQTRRPVGFVRCRRAAATALTAAVFTLMSVAGIALTSDHTHLVYQRDTLKAATDAACLAATRHLWTLGQDLSDEKVHAALRPIAERYILANIPESRRKRAAETLVIPPLAVDRQAGRVGVTAAADLGGAIFGSWMYGKVTQTTQVACLSEGEVADGTTPPTPGQQNTPDTPPMTELVLAIDITSSMLDDIDGCRTCGESRMSIVKRAAQKLVGTITADASRTVAVGLVPWHFRVKFDQETRTRWEDLGWAEYPTRRYLSESLLGKLDKYRSAIERREQRRLVPGPPPSNGRGRVARPAEQARRRRLAGLCGPAPDVRRQPARHLRRPADTRRAVYHGILFTNCRVPTDLAHIVPVSPG